MKEPISIDKHKPDYKGVNFEELWKEGMALLQQLSGEEWTDYNEHDPGVTILEQLCFALTEIGFKANQDIRDILSENNVTLHNNKPLSDTFYAPEEILSTHPVTVKDIRKILIGQILGVRNAWLELLNQGNPDEVNGLYNLFIEVSPLHRDEIEAIKVNVRNCLMQNSNLCEDIEEIVLLEPELLQLDVKIELTKDADVNVVLADILYEIDIFISKRIGFYSIEELEEKQLPYSKIYDGPFLEDGFLLAKDLCPRIKVVYNADLIEAIKNVQGINNIITFRLKDFDSNIDGKIIYLDKSPLLDTKISNSNFVFTKNNIAYHPDEELVSRKISDKKTASYRAYKVNLESRNDSLSLTGNSRNLSKYFSIQYNFPEIYAIGEYGVPASYPEKRKAQAKQLKAYLLFFEQIMANYLAQLGNIRRLYSLDKDLNQTFFYQYLHSVPKVSDSELYFLPENKSDDIIDLEGINKQIENFYTRRHTLLDHLLARFGEQFEKYTLSKFITYDNDDSTKHLLHIKTDFLKRIAEIGSRRSSSFNRTKLYWNYNNENDISNYNMSGLELKVRTLLGIDLQQRKFSQVISGPNLYIDKYFSTKGYYGPVYPEIHDNIIESEFEHIDFSLSHFQEIINQSEADCSPANIFINRELLEVGFTANSYKVGPDPYDNGKTYCIAFYNERSDDWQRVERFLTKEKAICALKRLIDYISILNKYSEGFYFVEHILLRPKKKENVFSVFILDASEDIAIKGTEENRPKEFTQNAEEIFLNIQKGNLFKEKVDTGYKVVIKDQYHIEIAHCVDNFQNEALADEKISQLKKYFSDVTFLDLYLSDKITMESNYDKHHSHIGHACNFTISVVMPCWSARFANQEFRKYVESLIIKNTPPHIVVNFIWEEREWIESFEEKFENWLHLYNGQQDNPKPLNTASYELLKMLLEKSSYHSHNLDINSLNKIYS